ncbi:hypothetical protein ACP70R_030506 [Stipagrostis hirtigluma subsp. patula]
MRTDAHAARLLSLSPPSRLFHSKNHHVAGGDPRLGGLPPGFRFVPRDGVLVEFYLLPLARGHPGPFPGVIEDDMAGTALPWDLLERHGRASDSGAYYCVSTGGANAGARQDRACEGGYKWRSQKRVKGALRVGGEEIEWSKNSLNLHLGDGGSIGWVMHEYTVTSPSYPSSVKICHIAVTAQGQKRKRVRDDDCQDGSASQRARVAAAAAATTTALYSGTKETFHQDAAAASPSATSAAASPLSGTSAMFDQDPAAAALYASAGRVNQEQHIVVSGKAEGEAEASLYWAYADSLPPLVTHDDIVWDPLDSIRFPSAESVNADASFEESDMATAASTEQPVEHVVARLPMAQESGSMELLCGEEDLQELLAPLQDDLGFGSFVSGIGDDMAAGMLGGTACEGLFCC